MISSSKDAADVVSVLRNTALTTDADRLEEIAENFTEHLEHSQEVSYKLDMTCQCHSI